MRSVNAMNTYIVFSPYGKTAVPVDIKSQPSLIKIWLHFQKYIGDFVHDENVE